MTLSNAMKNNRWLSVIALLPFLVACGEDVVETTETVRSIRTITVTEPASGKMRRYSGVVEAAVNSSISFEVSGNVQEVEVEVGERVVRGQVLAVLDEKVHALNVSAAQAAVGGAEAQVADARSALSRLQRLTERSADFVSKRDMEQAEAAYDAAQKNLSYNLSRLNQAQRDLERTKLRAPLDGVIAERRVDPFEEVQRGQPMFDLFVEGVMQAAVSIPESEINLVSLGLPGEVRFPAISDDAHKVLVSEISKVAGAGNAFPVKLMIDADDSRIRPGITAEVTMMLGEGSGEGAYLVPVAAIVPGIEDQKHVFVFNSETSTVVKTGIEDDGIRGSNVVVSGGLKAGDIVAVAGVSFLRDGQQVRLME